MGVKMPQQVHFLILNTPTGHSKVEYELNTKSTGQTKKKKSDCLSVLYIVLLSWVSGLSVFIGWGNWRQKQ